MTYHPVHTDYLITGSHIVLGGRHPLIRLRHINIAVALHNQCADTSVSPRGHNTEVVVLFLGNIDGVGIHRGEHTPDALLRKVIIVQRIRIVHIQLPQHIGKDCQTLFYAGGLLLGIRVTEEEEKHKQQEIPLFHNKAGWGGLFIGKESGNILVVGIKVTDKGGGYMGVLRSGVQQYRFHPPQLLVRLRHIPFILEVLHAANTP